MLPPFLILLRMLFMRKTRHGDEDGEQCKPLSKRASKPFSTLIILGSGGHIAEMLNLLAVLQKGRFNPRFYIVVATDNMSLQKAQLLENSLAAEYVHDESETLSDIDDEEVDLYIDDEEGKHIKKILWETTYREYLEGLKSKVNFKLLNELFDEMDTQENTDGLKK
ncbi:hypothetical protein JHK85_001508 [Glycine max]|nr:hypothetical protein JHK85_001508 [Glycine max]KAG5088854.1 hypothetical protein JHK86_001466 [Glycine max]